MALEVEATLAAVAVILGAAFLASLGFRLWRLPDVLLLIMLGVVLGPALHFLDVELFRTIGPLVGTVAIIMILFDGGLEIHFRDLRGGAVKGAVLGVVVFFATALLCAGVAHLVAGIEPQLALLLGLAFGGAGVVIVLPIIQQLGVQDRSVTIVSLEAAVSDVLVIVFVYGLATAIDIGRTDAAGFAQGLVAIFSIGIVVGLAAGFGWSRVLGHNWVHGYDYVLTLAALFLTHVAVEHLGGSGPLAVLAFGLVVGNSHRSKLEVDAKLKRSKQAAAPAPVFGDSLVGFHQESVFLVRAFFFVGLGATMHVEAFEEPRFLLTGILLAVAVAVARFWGVALLVRRGSQPAWDRVCIALMFPLGLAAAALSQIPDQRFGIPGTQDFASYAAVTIVATNVLSSLLVFVVSRPAIRRRLERQPGAARSARA